MHSTLLHILSSLSTYYHVPRLACNDTISVLYSSHLHNFTTVLTLAHLFISLRITEPHAPLYSTFVFHFGAFLCTYFVNTNLHLILLLLSYTHLSLSHPCIYIYTFAYKRLRSTCSFSSFRLTGCTQYLYTHLFSHFAPLYTCIHPSTQHLLLVRRSTLGTLTSILQLFPHFLFSLSLYLPSGVSSPFQSTPMCTMCRSFSMLMLSSASPPSTCP